MPEKKCNMMRFYTTLNIYVRVIGIKVGICPQNACYRTSSVWKSKECVINNNTLYNLLFTQWCL